MKSKEILFSAEARNKILAGVTTLSNAVSVTLGPKGRNVAIERGFGSPLITKDGVTVAKSIQLKDKFENMGAQMVKEVASKTNDLAGDGTTTATVLASAIYREGLKTVAAGANPVYLKRGIDKAVVAAVAELAKISKKVSSSEEIRQVATVSANWDTSIGNIIADAMDKVGKDGTITVEEASSMDTTLEVVEGMQFDKGFISAYFADQETQQAVLDDALVLVIEKKLTTIAPLAKFFTEIAKMGKKLLVIAEDVEGDALAFMVVNRVRGAFVSCAVKAPGFGDRRRATLEDIATITGAKLITSELGLNLDKLTFADLGQAKKIIVTKDSTTIIGGTGKPAAIEVRIKLIKNEIEKSTSDFEREKLQERLAKLTGGVAVVHTGAATESEMKEKKDRVEDALHATRAAVEEGIVPGGGVALLRCASVIDALKLEGDEQIGAQIVRRAIEHPIKMLCSNAGKSGDVVVSEVLKNTGNYGYNVATDVYQDLVVSGVVDPTKVTRTALQNAASIAGLLLTTECMIADIEDEAEQIQQQIPQEGM
jgi:chaperonin GroEL